MMSSVFDTIQSQYRHFRLLVDTALLVLGVVVARIFIDGFGLEFFSLSPLFTSVIAGGIFIVSLLLAGTLADYKESEKIPSEIAASLQSIYEDGRYLHRTEPNFNLSGLAARLREVIGKLRADLAAKTTRHALDRVDDLSTSFLEMEKLGTPPNYIVRLKQEQSNIRRLLLRIYHIQRIEFVPSAHVLVRSIILLIISLLLFTKIEPVYDGLIILAFISFLFTYLVKLIKTIDTPFRVDEYTMDDVSLFLLRELNERIQVTEANAEPAAP